MSEDDLCNALSVTFSHAQLEKHSSRYGIPTPQRMPAIMGNLLGDSLYSPEAAYIIMATSRASVCPGTMRIIQPFLFPRSAELVHSPQRRQRKPTALMRVMIMPTLVLFPNTCLAGMVGKETKSGSGKMFASQKDILGLILEMFLYIRIFWLTEQRTLNRTAYDRMQIRLVISWHISKRNSKVRSETHPWGEN